MRKAEKKEKRQDGMYVFFLGPAVKMESRFSDRRWRKVKLC